MRSNKPIFILQPHFILYTTWNTGKDVVAYVQEVLFIALIMIKRLLFTHQEKYKNYKTYELNFSEYISMLSSIEFLFCVTIRNATYIIVYSFNIGHNFRDLFAEFLSVISSCKCCVLVLLSYEMFPTIILPSCNK